MSNEIMKNGDILLYQNDTEKEFVNVVFYNESFWLTQSGMAELFACTADNVSLHLKNIYAEGELEQAATTEKFSVVRKEGTRSVNRAIDHYNLDAIIAVGYRVNSKKATRFRQWATKTLKEYIQKGFVLNDEMMKNPFLTTRRSKRSAGSIRNSAKSRMRNTSPSLIARLRNISKVNDYDRDL